MRKRPIASVVQQSWIRCFEAVVVFFLICICWVLGAAASSADVKQSEEARELVLNMPIRREISAGEKNKIPPSDYILTLSAIKANELEEVNRYFFRVIKQ